MHAQMQMAGLAQVGFPAECNPRFVIQTE